MLSVQSQGVQKVKTSSIMASLTSTVLENPHSSLGLRASPQFLYGPPF